MGSDESLPPLPTVKGLTESVGPKLALAGLLVQEFGTSPSQAGAHALGERARRRHGRCEGRAQA